MRTFTLDTNCIIDVAEERPAAPHVRALVAAHSTRCADVALVAASASERQRAGDYLNSLEVFNQRRTDHGLGDLQLLPSLARWNVSFFNHALWGGEPERQRETEVFSALFPNSIIDWATEAQRCGVTCDSEASAAYRSWRNKILDAQAYWAHEHAERDFFVTSDANFARRLHDHPQFPDATIMTPERAIVEL
ncbi:MAG: hypothetical protein AAFV27_11580 [Pseudomonadota bacterium]